MKRNSAYKLGTWFSDEFSECARPYVKYAEMEMKHRFVNHARNVWDRAVGLLPRVDQLWYKYIHMEEMMGQIANARSVFERWMDWEPDHQGWMSYIKMEMRYEEFDRARGIFERYTQCHPTVKAWVKWCKFEFSLGKGGASFTHRLDPAR